MSKTLQKIALGTTALGLAVAFLSAVLMQSMPQSQELRLSGFHTLGKALMFAGLVCFLILRVFSRHAARLRALNTLRVTVAGALLAAFAALWLWPLLFVFHDAVFLWAPFALAHGVGLAAFFLGGVAFIISVAAKELGAAAPTASSTSQPAGSLSQPLPGWDIDSPRA
jgi:hypothetical protein